MAIADQVSTDSGFPAKTDGAGVIKGINLASKTATGVDAHACSDENAEKLWTISEKLLAEV